MNLTIQLPDEDVPALNAKATARGVSAEQYALQVLEQDLAPEWLRQSWTRYFRWLPVARFKFASVGRCMPSTKKSSGVHDSAAMKM
jgi:hypothetical protein